MSGIRSERVEVVPIWTLKPAVLNDAVYKPVDEQDPEVVRLSEDIEAHGLLEPIVVTRDNVIVSGHRRRVACDLAGLDDVKVRRLPIRSTDPGFPALLVAFNKQRVKSVAEIVREQVAEMEVDAEDAHTELITHRARKAEDAVDGVNTLLLGSGTRRDGISKAKRPMLDVVIRVIQDNRRHWPMNDRAVHYQLLNHEVLRHASKPDSSYANDRPSYKDLCDLLTRARLKGLVPFAAIEDGTRPVTLWNCHPGTAPFVRQELDGLFKNYWRDLLQSQPCHVEAVAEKLTVQGVLRPVAADYCVPLTIGRGYASLDPRYKLAQRFKRSNKDRLVILFVSDFDPEGEDIARSFGRSLRDDFGIDESDITPVKVALTRQQVLDLRLPRRMTAKAGSSRRKAFVDANGENVFELEAVPADTLQRMLRGAIESVLDMDLFRAEQGRERAEAADLVRLREVARTALAGITPGEDS